MGQVSKVLAALSAGLALAGTARGAEGPTPEQAWWNGYLANAQAVKLPDGRTMTLYCEGKGAPAVVLDSGLGDGAWAWSRVQDQVAAKTRVCSYDRAGYGRSSPGPTPRDSKAIVADLAAVLKAAHVAGPYVLVAHSLGGYDARLFAYLHPKDVTGMVLVDPSTDDQMARLEAGVPKMVTFMDSSYSRQGPLAPCAQTPRPPERNKACVGLIPPGTSAAMAAFLTETRGPAYYQAVLDEYAAFREIDNNELVSARAARGPRPLGAMPLIVLTAGDDAYPTLTPDETQTLHKMWVSMHDEMADLSSKGANRVVEGAGHGIHYAKPQVVIDAVTEVVDAARAGQR